MDKAHTLKLFKDKIVQSLWHECDTLYARDPKGYIALQNTYQINVNLLLLAQWLDNLHINNQSLILNAHIWSELKNKVQTHDQDALIPFRQHRRASKSNVSRSQYQDMLKKELQLERQTQQYIFTELHILLQNTQYSQLHILPAKANSEAHQLVANSASQDSNAGIYLSLF
ncbi:DUF2390 domain-containing protein [uncultured Shewanella sp.]|uniref:DUF2390 domain-containing protein n=1 Tax=uncultured Shewanella sp. TaxID=173975 RepID=UPI00262BF03D|nr:DUF2390 domain-containing protein [uncultured Shewanella sp.]